jgi:hypothetical protein
VTRPTKAAAFSAKNAFYSNRTNNRICKQLDHGRRLFLKQAGAGSFRSFPKIELLTPAEQPVTSPAATGANFLRGQLQAVADARHSRDHVRLFVFLAPGDGVGEGLAGTGVDTVPLL